MLVDAIHQNEELRHRQYPTRDCALPASTGIPADWCQAFGDDDGDVVVLVGDSHANAWAPAFYELARRQPDLKIVRFSVGGCAPLVGTRRIDPIFANAPCSQFGFAERVLDAIRLLKPSHIFLLARWSLYTPSKIAARDDGAPRGLLARQLGRTLDALPHDVPVTIFRTAPVIRNEPARALLRHTSVVIPRREYVRREAAADAAIDDAVKGRPNVSAFDPKALFCPHDCDVTLNGTVLFANATHLSAQGALLAVDAISRLMPQQTIRTDMTADLSGGH
jgi:hypothetical protein